MKSKFVGCILTLETNVNQGVFTNITGVYQAEGRKLSAESKAVVCVC